MPVSFVATTGIFANATTTTLTLTVSVVRDEIDIAMILSKDNQVVTPPAGWTLIGEGNNTANQRYSLFWHRSDPDTDSGNHNFTKPTDNNLLFCGAVLRFWGCKRSGSPIDPGTISVSNNASSDTVTYATFDPTGTLLPDGTTQAFVVACGFYNNDLTTAGSIAGTDPTFANAADLETATGTDGSLFAYYGASSGAATGARSHSTTSTADDVNIGVMFGLLAENNLAFKRRDRNTYPQLATYGVNW